MPNIQVGNHLFTPDALQDAIAKTAPLLGNDKKGALVATLDTNGATVALQVRLNEHVEIQGAASWDLGTHDVAAGAKIIATW